MSHLLVSIEKIKYKNRVCVKVRYVWLKLKYRDLQLSIYLFKYLRNLSTGPPVNLVHHGIADQQEFVNQCTIRN
jgi:hypothetical protein